MGQLRVYFSVFGSGLGHITRILELSNRLAGADVKYSTSGQGLAFLEAKSLRDKAAPTPHLDVEWGPVGGFSSYSVLPRFPIMFNTFLRQLASERRSMAMFRPSVVVSDSKLSPVFAGRSLSYPVVTMLNQFKVLFPPRFRRGRTGRLFERIAADNLGLMWSLSDRVLVTDLPPPLTIGEANVYGSGITNIVEFVGFTTPRSEATPETMARTKEALGLGERPLVYCPISGPEATKGTLQKALLRACEAITRKYDLVISMGRSGGSTEPERLSRGGWLYQWCPVKDELFGLADAVVSRAGHSTIGQCIEHGKPAVLLPIHNHPEQIANSEKFRELGLGVDIRAERLTPEGLIGGIDSLLGDGRYRRRVESVQRVSARYRGIERCAEIIRGYS